MPRNPFSRRERRRSDDTTSPPDRVEHPRQEQLDAIEVRWQPHGDAFDAAQRDLAEALAASPDFGVQLRDHPHAPDADDELELCVYDEVRAIAGDPAIEALPAFIATLEHVTSCHHEDRELIIVRGPVDPQELASRCAAELARTGRPDPEAWPEFYEEHGLEPPEPRYY